MIYTSYFAKMKKYPNMEFVSIARFTPKGINIPTLKDLMPSEELLKKYKAKEINEEEYIRIYRQQLDNLDRMALGKMLQGKCLLCFEKPPTFCHRHLVAVQVLKLKNWTKKKEKSFQTFPFFLLRCKIFCPHIKCWE